MLFVVSLILISKMLKNLKKLFHILTFFKKPLTNYDCFEIASYHTKIYINLSSSNSLINLSCFLLELLRATYWM